MSVIDVLTQTHEDLAPAKVSATSVVEVWVERLDSAKGEEFGWERVPDVVRGHELLTDRRYGDVLSEYLVDKLFGFLTLWQGTVTLPADDARFRLVVAEYEEYLVDDSRPYDVVPTQKGRRLVFVEHVDLD
jgi:hypothetical protein